ncbi:MAG TPA: GSCFA domain-containing protein [Flavipsychrobacter sp.]
MQLILNLDIPPLPRPITYTDKILLIGSCFTENMSERLVQHKFKTLSNPHGILFNPLSVAHSLDSYIDNIQYRKEDLFYLNELYNSWDHHTRFSHTNADAAIAGINQSQQQAADFIKEANWVIITLGSAFQYYLVDGNRPVANNHRAPAQWFQKKLLTIEEITASLEKTLQRLHTLNPSAQVLFTISPVRHIRDGVVDNNRSKARLIEVVHALCQSHMFAHYFPAYELIIDILRDYRYYDIDMVHPNYLATSFVWEHFVKSCISADAQKVMKEVHDIAIARAHKTRFPDTEAHAKFKAGYLAKVADIQLRHPYLDMDEERAYFSA